MADDVQEIQQVILRLHQAHSDKDTKTALACYRDGYFLIDGSLDDPTQWKPWGYFTLEKGEKVLSERFAHPEYSYACTVAFLHTDVREDLAVVSAQEKGTSKGEQGTHSWDTNTIWCLAKIDGEWKIASSIHRVKGGTPR